MVENNENIEKLKKDLGENPKKVMEKYLENFNCEGRLKVVQANMLVKIILQDYGIKVKPWKVEDEESG
jgi:hypothetical protein